jgi:uncharacterized membrane protein
MKMQTNTSRLAHPTLQLLHRIFLYPALVLRYYEEEGGRSGGRRNGGRNDGGGRKGRVEGESEGGGGDCRGLPVLVVVKVLSSERVNVFKENRVGNLTGSSSSVAEDLPSPPPLSERSV